MSRVHADGEGRDGARTGIELTWRSLRTAPPRWWNVSKAANGERIARVNERWGFVAVPPGTYQVDAQLDDVTARAREVEVRAGAVTKITPRDFGLGQLMIEWPRAQGIVLIHGVTALEAMLIQNGQSRPLALRDPAGSLVTSWAREGDATIRFRGGAVFLEESATVTAGATRHVPFNAAALAANHGLSLVRVAIHDAAGKLATRDTQVTLLDARGDRLLCLTPNPPPNAGWLVPPGPVVRARLGNREVVRRNVPAEAQADVVCDFAPTAQPGEPVKIQVDVNIESPPEGAVVDKDRTTLIGRASSSGPAGALRIALVLDASQSALESSGADLDGNGTEDSIIQAEAAAGQMLLNALEKVEAKTPGTAFEVTVVRFAGTATTLAPLSRMTDAKGLTALRAALDRFAREGAQGGTNYVAALTEATRALQAGQRKGTCVVLMMSDGGPNELRPSLDASARTGLAEVMIHTFGLGKDFLNKIAPTVAFPPDPINPLNVMAVVAALGGPGGSVTALPTPAAVVQVVPRLPLLELPEAELKEVQVINETAGKPAFSVQLARDGAFQAEVPVSLLPHGPDESNMLVATAIARDGVSKASDRVKVLCPPQPGTLTVVCRDEAGNPTLPGALMPACELILDSSHSMGKNVGRTPKFRIAQSVMEELLNGLPDGVHLGLRLYGHLGFVPRRANRAPVLPNRNDPAIRRLLDTDSELVESISMLDVAKRKRIAKVISAAWPRGDTPLCYSLLQAKADFPARWTGGKLVILVSDGEENCGGKLEDVANAYRGSDAKVMIHVVGFDIEGGAAERQLEQLAQIGGGRYFDARNHQQLADALREALRSVHFAVYDSAGKAELARGLVNDRGVSLMPGSYRVGIVGAKEAPIAVRLGNREKREVRIDDAGRLEAPAGATNGGPPAAPRATAPH